MESVAVIDYGMGNLRSVTKALEHVSKGAAAIVVTADPAQIRAADRVVFPGVGAIRDCMKELRRLGLDSVIREAAGTRPFLGICLGLQALLEFSEENEGTDCLGVVPGKVRYFGEPLADPHSGDALKIPHMGWNQVHQCFGHPLWRGIAQDTRFYFVHSYYAEPARSDWIAGTADYGRSFACALARGSLFAVQFHPEKSQHAGLALLDNFLRWDGKP